jgi:thiol-activated cytolysin
MRHQASLIPATLWTCAAVAGALGLAGCTAQIDDAVAGDDPAEDRRAAIDDYIRGIGTLPADAPQVVEGETSAPAREGDYSCTRQDLSETRQHDKIVAYAANSETLWPGAIVRGDSVYDGLFTQVVLDREPLAFSVSLENLVGGKSAVMDSPSLSAYRNQLGDILASEINGATPANIYAELEEVHSSEQLSLALGASVSWLGSAASISSSFDFEQSEVRSRYLVKYTQAYFTVDVDQPSAPSDFFSDAVALEDVQTRFEDGNPPAYVSSITYGRMVVFTFESEYSSEELNAALEFAYRGGVDVTGDVSVTYKDILSSSKITAFILGGSGEEAARSFDSYEALMEFIHSGGNYSRDSPGAPIAYKLAYLADNEPARLSFTTDYTVQDCVRVSQKVRVTLTGITVDDDGGDAGDELEVYGNIWASAENQVSLFSRNADNYVAIREGTTWPQASFIAEGILDVVPQPGNVIRLGASLMDADGWADPDDDLGTEVVVAPFETGWRKNVDVLLTGDGARVIVHFSIEPI